MQIRKCILLSVLLLMKMFSSPLFSQCIPSTTISEEGISPKTSIPGCENARYDRTLFLTYKKDTVVFNSTFVIDSIFISSVNNLRSGLTYSVNQIKQYYTPGVGYYQNCINIFGTPTNSLKAYDTVAVNITAYISVFGTVNQFQDVLYAVMPVNPTPNVAVLKTGNILNAVMGATSYNWLLCDFGYAAIPNANGSVYTPTVSGNFAVEVDLNGCVDTSACFNVNITGVSEELTNSDLIVYPSLIMDELHIRSVDRIHRVEIIDPLGREVKGIDFDNNSALLTIPFEGKSAGTYLLKFYTDNRIIVKRVIKE